MRLYGEGLDEAVWGRPWLSISKMKSLRVPNNFLFSQVHEDMCMQEQMDAKR